MVDLDGMIVPPLMSRGVDDGQKKEPTSPSREECISGVVKLFLGLHVPCPA